MKAFTLELEAHRFAFLESLRVRGQSPATLKARSQSLSTFFLWMAGEGIEDVREITREHMRAYGLWLRSQPFTTHTVHMKLISLRRFFEHLEATDAVLINPCVGLILPKFEDRLPRGVLSQAEVRRVLDAPDTQTKKGIRDKAILELFYSTGIRGEEMAARTFGGTPVPRTWCKAGRTSPMCNGCSAIAASKRPRFTRESARRKSPTRSGANTHGPGPDGQLRRGHDNGHAA